MILFMQRIANMSLCFEVGLVGLWSFVIFVVLALQLCCCRYYKVLYAVKYLSVMFVIINRAKYSLNWLTCYLACIVNLIKIFDYEQLCYNYCTIYFKHFSLYDSIIKIKKYIRYKIIYFALSLRLKTTLTKIL